MEKLLDFLRTDRAKLIICLLIAGVIWSVNEMSKTYQTAFPIVLHYQYPGDFLPTEAPPSEIRATLSGEGWNLFRKRFRGVKDSILIDVTGPSSHYVSTQSLRFNISNAIESDKLSLAQLRKDGFNIELVPRAEKMVPVKSQIKYEIPDQYGMDDSLRMDPDSVLISGPSNIIEATDSWPTVSKELGAVEGAIETTIDLQSPETDLIQLNPDQTTVLMQVEPFTEQSFFVKLDLDKPSEQSYRIFPREVQVKFEVGMSRYDQISTEEFDIGLEEFEVQDSVSTSRLVIKKQPEGIRKLRFSPKEVEIFYVNQDTLESGE